MDKYEKFHQYHYYPVFARFFFQEVYVKHLLIHQISMDGLWGKYEEIKQEVENSDKFMDTIKNIYREKTKIPSKKLEEFMKKDVYLGYEECITFEIVSGHS